MRRSFRYFFLTIFLFSSTLTSLYALSIPKRPQGYVSDYAGILSPAARQNLEAQLRQFEDQTSNQLMVVTFPSLEGDSLEGFSIRLAEAWRPGQKGKDNGAVLLIFKEDRKVRIEVGYGLEGVLTDAVSSLIIQNEIVPRFRAGNYDEGIQRAAAAMMSATRGEYTAKPRARAKSLDAIRFAIIVSFMVAQFVPETILWILFFGINFLGLAAAIATRQIALGLYTVIFSVLLLVFHFLRGARYSSGFSSGGYYRSDGGGFGGFSGGGGGFGGGGASGSW